MNEESKKTFQTFVIYVNHRGFLRDNEGVSADADFARTFDSAKEAAFYVKQNRPSGEYWIIFEWV